MKNACEVHDDSAYIVIKRRDGSVYRTIVDSKKLQLLDSVSTVYVCLDKGTNRFYAHALQVNEPGKYVKTLLHRLITDAPAGFEVDHINHDTLDNRSCNLRICTKSENQQNRKAARVDNKTSGIRGVSWNKKANKWIAHIRAHGKRITVGRFTDIRDAENAVIQARIRYMPYSKESSGVSE